MVRWAGTAALAAAALACACAALPHAASAQEGLQPAFAYGGTDCVEPSVTVPVPVERARAAVPEPYVPRSLSGDPASADVLLAVARCRSLSVDGRALPGGTVVDAGVVIHTPDGTPGAHVYQLWHLSDAREVSARMAAVGVRGGQVAGLAVGDGGPGALETATATVPWSESPYDLGIEAAAGATPAASTTWWHRGPRGVVRLDYTFPRAASRFGTGRVGARAGSPLARLLGGASTSGSGYVGRLDFAGQVRAEQPPAAAPSGSGEAPGPAPAGRTGDDAGSASPSAPSRAARLRVAVTPRRVRAGRRTRLTVRVTRAGRPVRGATVRLGARRARTAASGRARLVVRLRRGRHRLTATPRSGAPARATVLATAR